MAWQRLGAARNGQYIMAEVNSGWSIGTMPNAEEMRQRITEYADGWTVQDVELNKGVLFGIGGYLRIFGVARQEIPSSAIAGQVSAALDSFWFTSGTSAAVSISDDPVRPSPPGDVWATTIQLASLALFVIAGVYVYTQLKGRKA
jgi:hypothetical protein